MTAPDPVTDVWELLCAAACDHRDANPPPHNSTARLIDALMPVVQTYGDARAADALAPLLALASLLDREARSLPYGGDTPGQHYADGLRQAAVDAARSIRKVIESYPYPDPRTKETSA